MYHHSVLLAVLLLLQYSPPLKHVLQHIYIYISTPFNFVAKLEKLDALFLSSRIPEIGRISIERNFR